MPLRANYRQRKVQVGIESVSGTPVAATWQLIGEYILAPMKTRYFADYPRGVRAPVTGGGVEIAAEGQLSGTSDATFEELAWMLATMFGAPAITTTLGASVWVFTPNLTGDPAPKSFTLEYLRAEGGTNYYAAKAAFGLGTDLSLNFPVNQRVDSAYKGVTQAVASGITPTPALTPLTGREVLAANNTTWTIDDTWTGLGGTSKIGLVRSAKLDLASSLQPDPTMDGRTDYSWGQYQYGNIGAHLQLVCEHNLDAQAELSKWEARTLRFIRAKNVSPNIVGTGAVHKAAQFDLSMIYAKEPAFSRAGDVELATLDLQLEYDSVSAKAFLATIINGLAALT